MACNETLPPPFCASYTLFVPDEGDKNSTPRASVRFTVVSADQQSRSGVATVPSGQVIPYGGHLKPAKPTTKAVLHSAAVS